MQVDWHIPCLPNGRYSTDVIKMGVCQPDRLDASSRALDLAHNARPFIARINEHRLARASIINDEIAVLLERPYGVDRDDHTG